MKGHVFTETDIPAVKRKNMSPQERADWCAEQTERYRIVAIDAAETDEHRQGVIAEEVELRAINRLRPNLRRLARTILRLPLNDRATLLEAFSPDGKLRLPFKLR